MWGEFVGSFCENEIMVTLFGFCYFRYTAVIAVTHGGTGLTQTTPLYKLVKNIARSKFVEKVRLLSYQVEVKPKDHGCTPK